MPCELPFLAMNPITLLPAIQLLLVVSVPTAFSKPPSPPQCPHQVDCPSGAACYDGHCYCQVGHLWSVDFTSCYLHNCTTDFACLTWPNSFCSPKTNSCVCDENHRLEEGGLVCSITVENLIKRILGWELIVVGLLFVFGFGICMIYQSREQQHQLNLIYRHIVRQQINGKMTTTAECKHQVLES